MTAPPGNVDGLRAHLLERFNRARTDVLRARLHRQIYQEMRDEIIERYPHADATFLKSYSSLYAPAQIMTVRRLADKHHDGPDPLRWTIQRIRNNPSVASRSQLRRAVSERRGEVHWAVDDADAYFRVSCHECGSRSGGIPGVARTAGVLMGIA